MPMTPGYYMPNYMQPGYSNYYSAQPVQQQSYAPAPQQQNTIGMIWVDGEVGAKAYQMPAGWPAGSPIPLWDTNDAMIYLKSINQMGMPNPLYKIRYTMEDQNQKMLPQAQNQQMSGDGHAEQIDTSKFVTKEDIDQFKNEIKEMFKQNQSGNTQNGNQNRGGNR